MYLKNRTQKQFNYYLNLNLLTMKNLLFLWDSPTTSAFFLYNKLST